MRVSHSKLSLALSDPMSYFLRYKMGITPLQTKKAFEVGSAVHYGLEHWTSDLSDYWGTHTFDSDYCLSEAMVAGFLSIKDRVFKEILTNKIDGEVASILPEGEKHELNLYAPLHSFQHPDEPHIFQGIIDMLLLTDKGFIIIDWKTSSKAPDWNGYLEQIYRYIFICQALWPDIPVYKVGIVNLRKTRCVKGAKETDEEWKARMVKEFTNHSENYYYVHTWEPQELDQNVFNEYKTNLSRQVDVAEMIDKNCMFYINFGAQISQYGESDYYKIFYKTKDAYALYNIRDTVLDDKNCLIDGIRPCIPLDMEVIDRQNVINKYSLFKEKFIEFVNETGMSDKYKFYHWLENDYSVDLKLLDRYWSYLCIESSQK